MHNIYIFDLDGTLALIDHRRPHVEAPMIRARLGSKLMIPDPDFKPNWKAFYAACDDDEPNADVIVVMMKLIESGNDVRIWSGRSDEVREKTVRWLSGTTGLSRVSISAMLTMRAADDYTPDDLLKLRWLGLLTKEERAMISGVFDDRDKVVKMWRDNGLTCFQVAPGAF